MIHLIPLFTLISPAAFVATSILSWFQSGIRPLLVIRFGMVATILSLTISLLDALSVAVLGSMETGLLGIAQLGFSIRLDSLSVLMLNMISLLGFVVFKYSINYLDGDNRQGVFLGRLALAIASVQLLVITGNLGLLWVSWVMTSVCLHRLLLFYPERPGAIIVARKKFIVARLSDLFLLAAVVLLYLQFGTGNLGLIFQSIKSNAPALTSHNFLEASALCLAIAACLKSAQFPTHGWLVEVMETPTPVSALLHAGLLNAGPYLIVRMAYVMDASYYSPLILMTIGGVTALFASIVFMTQTSIKTTLGFSSVAHMGFSLMVCGLGVYPAAMLHLISHSLYKAHAFLSSGSIIDEVRAAKITLPKRLGNPFRIVLGVVLALVVYGGFSLMFGIDPSHQSGLLAVGAIIILALARILTTAIDSDGGMALFYRSCLFAAMVTVSFFAFESITHAIISSQIPTESIPNSAKAVLMGIILGVCLVTVLVQILAPVLPWKPAYQSMAVHFRNGLYFNVLFDRMVGALHVQPAKSRLRQ